MLRTAIREIAHLHVIAIAAWITGLPVAALAQGPLAAKPTVANSGSPMRQNPFRTVSPIQPAQFQEIGPLVPSAEDEARSPEAAPAPSADPNPSVAAPAGAPRDLPPPRPLAADSNLSGPTPMEQVFGGPYEQSLMYDDATMTYSTNSTYRRGFWYSQAEVVALLRTEGEDIPISADQSDRVFDSTPTNQNPATNNRPALTSKTTDPTYEPGVRLTFGRFLGQDYANRDHALEFTFLGLFQYESDATIVSDEEPGFLDTALGAFKSPVFQLGIVGNNVIPGFTGALQHSIAYDSDFSSYELNFRVMGRPRRDRIDLMPNGRWVRHGTPSSLRSFLIGLRGTKIDERFTYISTFLDPDEDSGFYRVATRNNMFGVQGGIELMENYSAWTFGARFKGGVLYNFSERDSFLNTVSFGDESTRSEMIQKDNLGAVLDGGVTAAYQLRTNLVARVSYDAMYVTGIATAPENLGLDEAFPNFEVTGDAVYHGFSLGFEMLW